MNSLKSKKEQIKEKSTEIALNSSVIGLSNIFRTEKTCLKFMWIILFVISLGGTIYTVIKVLNNYLEYEVITNINVVTQIPAEFPAVTFYLIQNNKDNIKLSDFLYLGIFNKSLFNQQVISENDFEEIKDEFNFTSFKFKPKKSFMDGELFGLKLYFDLTNIVDNIKVIIHNDSDDSGYHAGYSRKGFDLKPGYDYKISIKKVLTEKLGQPYNDCLKDVKSRNSFDSDLYRYILDSTKYLYKQRDCFEYCIGKEFYKYLNITNKIDHWTEIAQRYPDVEFKDKFFQIITKIIEGELNEKCIPFCPLECDSIKYEQSMYSNQIDVSSIVSLNIFYESLEYTVINQKAKMDEFDLISNIGGNLGLFIGVSFLSLAEFIELFVETIYIMLKKIEE